MRGTTRRCSIPGVASAGPAAAAGWETAASAAAGQWAPTGATLQEPATAAHCNISHYPMTMLARPASEAATHTLTACTAATAAAAAWAVPGRWQICTCGAATATIAPAASRSWNNLSTETAQPQPEMARNGCQHAGPAEVLDSPRPCHLQTNQCTQPLCDNCYRNRKGLSYNNLCCCCYSKPSHTTATHATT
jgi:hypothetical protein